MLSRAWDGHAGQFDGMALTIAGMVRHPERTSDPETVKINREAADATDGPGLDGNGVAVAGHDCTKLGQELLQGHAIDGQKFAACEGAADVRLTLTYLPSTF